MCSFPWEILSGLKCLDTHGGHAWSLQTQSSTFTSGRKVRAGDSGHVTLIIRAQALSFNVFLSSTANNCRGLLYHIQYFSDTPERGYIAGKNLVVFSEKEQYQTLCCGKKKSTDGKKVLILFTHTLLSKEYLHYLWLMHWNMFAFSRSRNALRYYVVELFNFFMLCVFSSADDST